MEDDDGETERLLGESKVRRQPIKSFNVINGTISGDLKVSNGVTSAVSATIHTCRAEIMRSLNLLVISPHLYQEGILPIDSADQFDGIVPLRMQINNLVIILCGCTEKKFRTLISILRWSVSEAGDAHRELADMLEEKFEEYKRNGYSDTTIMQNCVETQGRTHTMMTYSDSDVMVQSSPQEMEKTEIERNSTQISKGFCKICTWKLCCGITFCASLTILLLAIQTAITVSIHNHISTYHLDLKPTMFAGSTIMEVEFSNTDFKWIKSIQVEIDNCSGHVFVFHGSNCGHRLSVFQDFDSFLWRQLNLPRYLLRNSIISINMSNFRNQTVLILKSLANYKAYMELCREIGQVVNLYCENHKTIPYLCDSNPSTVSLKRGNDFWCFDADTSFTVNQSDYYYVLRDQLVEGYLVVGGTAYTYNSSLVSSQKDGSKYTTAVAGGGRYALSFPISGNSKSHEMCVLLQTVCASNCSDYCDIQNITYSPVKQYSSFTFTFLFQLVWILIMLIVTIIIIIRVVIRNYTNKTSPLILTRDQVVQSS